MLFDPLPPSGEARGCSAARGEKPALVRLLVTILHNRRLMCSRMCSLATILRDPVVSL